MVRLAHHYQQLLNMKCLELQMFLIQLKNHQRHRRQRALNHHRLRQQQLNNLLMLIVRAHLTQQETEILMALHQRQ
jgi:hypothetical protein